MNKDPSKLTFELTFASSTKNIEGDVVDMYILCYDPNSETGISLGVPYGRKDIAEYIYQKLAN